MYHDDGEKNSNSLHYQLILKTIFFKFAKDIEDNTSNNFCLVYYFEQPCVQA